MRRILLLAPLVAIACGSGTSSEIDTGFADAAAGRDAATTPDAQADAGHRDATPPQDTGAPQDSGPPQDAAAPDAGTPADAAPRDAGCVAPRADCDGDGLSCEVDTSTNGLHCGRCGRSCLGQGCEASLCRAREFAARANGYRQLVARGNVYVMRVNAFPPSMYTLDRVPTPAGMLEPVATGPGAPGGLAADDTYVYFAVRGNPSTVYRKAHTAPAAEAPAVFFTTPAFPEWMEIRSGVLWWISATPDSRIYRRAVNAPMNDTGTARSPSSTLRPLGFAATSTTVYWVDTDNNTRPLHELAMTSTTPRVVHPGPVDSALHADERAVYWTLRIGPGAGVYRHWAGGAPRQVVLREQLLSVWPEPSSTTLYIGEGIVGTHVWSVDKRGGPLVDIALRGAGADFAGSDAMYLYTVDAPLNGSPGYRIVR